jgi:Flp pilus assembly protein TadG
VSIWALLVTTTAFTGLLGLVVDGGAAVNARLDAARTAAQAARLGADQLSAGSVRAGGDAVDAAMARAAARDFLDAAGRTGTVTVRTDRVSVTVTGTSPTRVLGIVGIDAFAVRETQTAQGITGQDRP